MSEVLSEVSGRSEGGVENRPPSSKPPSTQVFSEIEGGLGLKTKIHVFLDFEHRRKKEKAKVISENFVNGLFIFTNSMFIFMNGQA